MIEEITIKNEDEAWNALERALRDDISETAKITFEGWPVFRLTIEGKDFNSTIPTRIMPPIMDLQKEIHRIYCRTRYNSNNTKKLTAKDKELLELIVEIKPGSSKYITKLSKALNQIIKNSNMNGKEVVVLLVGISVVIGATVSWKDWVLQLEKKHSVESTIKMSEQENKRLNIVTQAMVKQAEILTTKAAIDDFKSHLAIKLKPSDQIKINNQKIINGVRAAKVVPAPKATSKEIRIDGEFYINEVKFPQKFGGNYRFSVTRKLDDKSFMVDVSPSIVSTDQINILKDGAFGIKLVIMQINAKELRGNITSAKVVSISWPEKK